MTTSNSLLAGTASVTVDGVTIMVAGDFEYSPSTKKRETLTGMDGVHGFKESYIAGFISCQVRDGSGTSVTDFNSQTDVTVSAELANGKTIIGTGMWSVESQEVDSTEATFKVRWESNSVTEN